jgi:GntR family transcriptional regulator, arabinose operon transcriptional repressor
MDGIMADDQLTPESLNTAQPKNMAVAAKMREILAQGRWAPGDQIPTARQLAQMFGVSLSPVLQALQILEKEGLLLRRARVGTFVAERRTKKDLLAFITASCELEPYIHALWGFEEEASRRGYHILFCNANRVPERLAQLATACMEQGAAGIAFTPPEGSFYMDWNRAFYKGVAEHGMPLVAITSQPFPEEDPAIISASIPDGIWQGRRLAAHLIDQGHTHLAFLYGRWSCTIEDRKQGVIAEVHDRGLPPVDVRSLSPEELLRTGEVYDVSAMLGEWLGQEPPITAVVCCSDYAARIVFEHVTTLGMSIPEDIAVVGFDDSSFAPLLGNGLTTIRVSYIEMGRSAAELLVAQINDPSRPPRILMSRGELVVRHSCRYVPSEHASPEKPE